MRDHARPKWLTLVCVLVAAFLASRAAAQTAPPLGVQSQVPTPPSAAAPAAEVGPAAGCKTPVRASAGGASVVQGADESLQRKSWQAEDGEIQFTVKSLSALPPEASVIVCFRWKSTKSDSTIEFKETPPSRLELSGDGRNLKVTTTVPHLGSWPSAPAMALPLVPLAEVRILAIDEKAKQVKADASTAIGITYPVVGFLLAIATVALGFVILHIAVGRRLKHAGILKANWLLRIISTPSGYASLSQFQILLWTFVVAASAVYVMSLSGQLIVITNGMLVLLGIAGAAGVGAKAHSEAQGATVEATAAKAAADKAAADVDAAQKAAAATATAAAADPAIAARLTAERDQAAAAATAKSAIATATKGRADALKNPPDDQVPRWSDLIVNENVKDDGTHTREIDVTRFQMLLFTLIGAVFVLMNVVTTYVIPEIPSGFQILLGISNGVYLGSKVVQQT